jgi:prepilin-type N-terminal cleavage/methylation domain-containing protein
MLEANRKNAFTLIELSIVLVIIGLVIGGVLVGQELIKSAQIRSQVSQIQDLETQINTFRLKYNCLPGDCTNATDVFGTTFAGNTIYNGDGNGLILSQASSYIAGSCLSGWTGSEVTQIFLHLNLSGLAGYTATGILGAVGANGSVIVGTDLPTIKFYRVVS